MNKLDKGDFLPDIKLKMGEADVFNLPSDIETDYIILLFYRGHWWPFCRRQLDGFEKRLSDFKTIGTSIIAASVDPIEKAQEVAESVSFPVAWGVDREIGKALGSFWDEERDFIQPTELVVNKQGLIISSTYSSSPLGRVNPEEALLLMKFLASRDKSQG